MADPAPSLHPDDGGVGPNRRPADTYPGTPRWVKLSGIGVIVLVLLVVIVMVASGGSHGPGRHLPSGAVDGNAPPIALEAHQPWS